MATRKRINDITPAEWDAMAARGRETQEKYEAEIKAGLYGNQIWNNPSLKAGVTAQLEARDEFIKKEASDGSTASYYELPSGARELQDLISYKNMNAQIGEIFRECYRYGQSSHSDELRGVKKILFYAQAELKRLGG